MGSCTMQTSLNFRTSTKLESLNYVADLIGQCNRMINRAMSPCAPYTFHILRAVAARGSHFTVMHMVH
jgi:hypothetical protein